MLYLAVWFTFLACAYSGEVNFTDCGSDLVDKDSITADVAGCDQVPCQLVNEHNHVVSITFTPTKDIDVVYPSAYGFSDGEQRKTYIWLLWGPNQCYEGENCPKAGQNFTHAFEVHLSGKTDGSSTKVQVHLMREHRKIFVCISFDVIFLKKSNS